MGFEPMHAGQGYVAILVRKSVRNSLGDLLQWLNQVTQSI